MSQLSPFMRVAELVLLRKTLHHKPLSVTVTVHNSKYGTPGWIWFNMSQLSPFMRVAELVLLRKTLHHKPLSVTVTVHSLSPGPDNLSISGPLAEHLLSLDRLPPSGYDVFDVTAAITHGSLVLHEALTQSLYCLNGSSLSQPAQTRPSCMASSEDDRQRIHLRHGRHLAACKLYVHHVNLHTSKLSQWILQPSSFNISICRYDLSVCDESGGFTICTSLRMCH
uniref:Uncharacterized protein n=1 Tax=Sinocyclocheilus grahami TaxID=75366 RepID=A0A672N570_SINGR